MRHLPILICIVFMGLLAACSNPQKDTARAQEGSYEAPPGATQTGQSTTGAPGDTSGSGPPVYRVLYTGREGQPTDAMRQEALKAAAKTARAQGHTHFAVIEERIETVVGSGQVSGVGVNIPVVRSRRAGGRSRSGGGSTSIQLGRPTAPGYLLRITPFTGQVPDGAKAVYAVEGFE